MNISFGQLKYKSEIRNKTEKQAATDDIVVGIIRSAALDRYLSQNLKADIVVTRQKDGNTKISVVSSKNKKPIKVITPLQINNKRFLMNIFKQVEEYVKTCRQQAESLAEEK